MRTKPFYGWWVTVAAICTFAVAYRFHAAWLMAEVLTLDDMRATPAEVKNDGRDFVKTNKWVVFGHHFAAIAGPDEAGEEVGIPLNSFIASMSAWYVLNMSPVNSILPLLIMLAISHLILGSLILAC